MNLKAELRTNSYSHKDLISGTQPMLCSFLKLKSDCNKTVMLIIYYIYFCNEILQSYTPVHDYIIHCNYILLLCVAIECM